MAAFGALIGRCVSILRSLWAPSDKNTLSQEGPDQFHWNFEQGSCRWLGVFTAQSTWVCDRPGCRWQRLPLGTHATLGAMRHMHRSALAEWSYLHA
eukprot:363396-Chlamydomonas_euryale.AAC.5